MTGPGSSDHLQRLLEQLCDELHQSARQAARERKAEIWGDSPPVELLLMCEYGIRLEIRAENAPHQKPHLHIKHSDKIDASLSLETLEVLAGSIDGKTLRRFRTRLEPKREELFEIWNALNGSTRDARVAHKLVRDIKF